MKRILSLTLSLALVALVASAGFARDVVSDSRLFYESIGTPPTPVTTESVRADTFFLFAASGAGAYGAPGTNARGYTFDDGAGGPATAGWTIYDTLAQTGAWWHLADATMTAGHATDFTGIGDFDGVFNDDGPTVNNDFSWWCGRENVCAWTHPTGYGFDWNQWIVLAVPAAASAGSIEFDFVGDYEGDAWDFFTLYTKTGSNDPVEIFSNHVVGEQIVTHVGPVAFGDVDQLIFAFKSDGNTCDQDGLFPTDIGAVWLDNFELVYTGAPPKSWDFEDNIQPAELTVTYPAGPGTYGALYANLFSEDACVVNSTYAWAFFDLNTFNPEYPIPVIPYGPPYVDNGVQSPILEKAHVLGDATGVTVNDAQGASSQLLIRTMVYRDLPLDPLIFFKPYVSAQIVGQPCLGTWRSNTSVYYGPTKQWDDWFLDFTLYLAQSAGSGTIDGVGVRWSVIDMCEVWCDVNGSGENHTPAPYFDTMSVMLVNTSSIAWNIDVFRRFQDNFPEANGKVRIDSSINVEPTDSPTVVIGDSTLIGLNMDGNGGIKPDLVSVPGETRPFLYMYSRVVAGPHTGSTNAAMGDVDDLDGCYSPHIGTAVVNGETWNVAIADTARNQGTNSPGSWSFDFAEDFFDPGDVIEFYYQATAVDGTMQTRPVWAESTDPDLRTYYVVRCLPTAGATMLFADDGGVEPWWVEAFRYNGYEDYDIFYTQAPSSGLNNGLAGRATIDDISQYDVIAWDSADLPSGTITNIGPFDKVFDDELLDDWLSNSSHNTCLWAMGNEIASDLEDDPNFLNEDLGATHILDGTYYKDLTGILVPEVSATHPALAIGGLEPYFNVDAGCPTTENLDLVIINETSDLAVEAFAWEVNGGTQALAGIYNQDPDGNGTVFSAGGFTNRTLYNPYSYFEVWDSGFGVGDGYDYARRMVGDVLTNLCGFEPNGTPDGVDTVPASFALKGNFPNPFNPKTTIRFALAADEYVHLNVYDLGGRLVKTLIDEPMKADNHEVVWDGKDNDGARVASGVYFYKLVAGDFNATEKMVMLK
jgi:hypothetical protein